MPGTHNIHLGATDVSGVYMGAKEVQTIYLGSQEVYSAGPAVITLKYKAPAQIVPNVAYTDSSWTATFSAETYDPATSAGTVTFIDAGSGLTIPNGAYSAKTSIAEFIIPRKVTSIGEDAFQSVYGLAGTLTIPKTVTSIGDRAFYACSALTEVFVPDSVTSDLTECFQNCSALTEVHLSSAMTAIGDNMCMNCGSLTGITIPEGITSIGEYAFFKCPLVSAVTIPASVTSIDTQAFSQFEDASALNKITFKGTTPPTTDEMAFTRVATAGTIYCPVSAVAAYTSWKNDLAGNIFDWTVEADAPANNEVWYTTSAGTVSTRIENAYFYGASNNRLTPVSNTYSDGLGVLKFSEDVVKIGGGNSSMFDVRDCVTLVFPESIRIISDYTFIESYAGQVKSVKFSGGYLTSVGHECFHKCPSLETLEMPEIRGAVNFWCFGGNTAQTAMTFTELSGLTNWYVTLTYPSIFDLPNMKELRMPGLAISTDLSRNQSAHNNAGVMTAMTESAWATLFNDLATVSNGQQLGIGTNILANLSAETKAIATNKGWTLW